MSRIDTVIPSWYDITVESDRKINRTRAVRVRGFTPYLLKEVLP